MLWLLSTVSIVGASGRTFLWDNGNVFKTKDLLTHKWKHDPLFLSVLQHHGVSSFTTFEASSRRAIGNASIWWATLGVMEQTVIANHNDVIVANLVMELGDFSVHRSNVPLAANVRGTRRRGHVPGGAFFFSI